MTNNIEYLRQQFDIIFISCNVIIAVQIINFESIELHY